VPLPDAIPSVGAVGQVTCTLPATQQALCGAIVDDFIARYAPPSR
jgi:hypothetical protein